VGISGRGREGIIEYYTCSRAARGGICIHPVGHDSGLFIIPEKLTHLFHDAMY
jgi:hypothetical protein